MRNSCEPCRKRKIKCTQEKPVCSQCERLRKKCVYLAGLSARDHIASLEEKIKVLESQVGGGEGAGPSESRRNTPPSAWDTHPRESTSSVNHLLSDDQISLSPSRVARLPLVGHLMGEIHLQEKPDQSELVKASMAPPKEVWTQLLGHYCDHTSVLYPIFQLPVLVHQFHQVLGGEAVSRHVYTCVMMVLAVSMTSLAPHSPFYERWKQQAPTYYALANQHCPPPGDVPTVERLQLALINLQYVIYNPAVGSIWNTARVAVSIAVELNLHHESPDNDALFSPAERDLRRKLFWVTYSHERNVCITLGRPPAIPDNWINTPYPLAQDESGNDTQMVVAIHRFRLRLLQSELQERLYSPSASLLVPPPEWYDDVVRRLDDWRASLSVQTGEGSPEWLNTKYHLTLLLLYRPSPCQPTPSVKGLADAMSSAGAVMRSFRELHRTSQITYNWFTVYQLFVANVTYLNCLYQAVRSGWNIVSNQVEAILDLQASSSVIQAVVAITPGTSRIRDACEAIGERSVRMIMSAMSPSTNLSQLATNAPSWPDNTDFSTAASDLANLKTDPLLDAFLIHPVAFTPAADWERIFGMESTFG